MDKTANVPGLTVPATLLTQVDEVIERQCCFAAVHNLAKRANHLQN
jgi:hypothetical protein